MDSLPLRFLVNPFLAVFLGVFCGLFFLGGCGKKEPEPAPPVFFLQVGTQAATEVDFQRALDIQLAAYPNAALEDENTVKNIKELLLKEFIERLILLERADELNIRVSEEELQEMIQDIRSDYPEGEFEKNLLETAISFEAWKSELQTRMLMEKVVAKELGAQIVNMGLQVDSSENGAEPDSGKGPYQKWIDSLKARYTITINEKKWQELLGSPSQ